MDSRSLRIDWTFADQKFPLTSSDSFELVESSEFDISFPVTFVYGTTTQMCICRGRTANPTDLTMARSASQNLQQKLLLERNVQSHEVHTHKDKPAE